MIRILVADDHTLLRAGLIALLGSDGNITAIGQASDGREAVELCLSLKPDVLLLDLSMPRLNGLDVIRRLAQELPSTAILVLTMHSEVEYVLHTTRAGARGFLLKDAAGSELLDAVRALARGETYFGAHAQAALARQALSPAPLDSPYRNLTDREREVFHLLIEGMTTKEIARTLDISVKTAENHRSRVLEKLECRNAAEAIRYAVQRGLAG
jgi:two-component system, NarL family, response regulator NreC